MFDVREETAGDEGAVREVNIAAFGRPAEAGLVDALRAASPDLLSLVAECDDQIVGHILFTPATIEEDGVKVDGMALGPMAVLPTFQRRGAGSALVREGIEILRAHLCPFIIVLGHASYYLRFGFEPASKRGIRCKWDGVPDDAFMILVMDDDEMDGVSGLARYRPEFEAMS